MSPTRYVVSYRFTSASPGRGGLSTACSSLFRFATPSSVFTCGVSTCTSRNGSIPNFAGMRSRTIWMMRSRIAAGSFASTK